MATENPTWGAPRIHGSCACSASQSRNGRCRGTCLASRRRRILHFDVTANPASAWVIQQRREAFPFGTAPRHVIFDRDAIFSAPVLSTMTSVGKRLGHRRLLI
jgi:hypothetical protein